MPKTLLVVDDSPTIREAARLALTGEDWAVVDAATPDDALELLWAQPPAAILCDADLAGAGVELCRKIRGLPEGRELPILLMGAAATPAAAAATGAAATLAKPFGAAELSDALQAALDAQGFSMDLDGLGDANEAPLTLRDLDVPYAAPAAAPIARANEVEIIDLSGDEEYGELELIEDLEPLETMTEGARAPQRAPAPDALSFDAADLFSSPAPSVPEPAREELAEEIDLDTLFAAAPVEPSPVEAPDEFLEELPADEPLSMLPTQSPSQTPWPEERVPPAGAIPLGAGAPVVSWDEPFVPEEIPSPPMEEPLSYEPKWEEPSVAEAPGAVLASPAPLAASTEEAVRQALTASLSLENLTPTVERVVERVVWEVVPRLAERLIREAIEKLQAEPPED